MPSWSEVLHEIQGERIESPVDRVRRRYLRELHGYTGRNVIAYYSGWLTRPGGPVSLSIDDADKNAFMSAVHTLDRSLGLDLLLHTPGGDVAATESLVDYLRKMFGTDMRAIVPQLAMSAGTMIACACRSIVMGNQSNLGPIDPQFRGIPAAGVTQEFKRAIQEVRRDPAATPIWQAIIGKYHPTFLQTCENAMVWGKQMTREWLVSGMFESEDDAEARADKVITHLADTDQTLNHARHIHIEQLEELGLKVERLEADDKLQDLVLTIHHAFMHTFAQTPAVKIVENHNGSALVLMGAPQERSGRPG